MCINHFKLWSQGKNFNRNIKSQNALKEANSIIRNMICEVPGCRQYYFGSGSNRICPFHHKNPQCKESDNIMICIIKGCENIIETKQFHSVCKRHLRTFGANPPTEIKRCQHSLKKNRSHSKLYAKFASLYKEYNMASINHDWQSSYSERENNEITADQNFPLEKQKEFALVRKHVIRIAKKEQDENIMAKRFTRERASEQQPTANSTIKRLLKGEHVLSKHMAFEILQNIKKRGTRNIGNYRDAIVAEAKKLMGSDANDNNEKDEPVIYKHIPIKRIDEFVGWSSSHRAKNDASSHIDHLHSSSTPQMPSAIAFLRLMLEKKIPNRIKQIHASNEGDSKPTQQLSARFDRSALQAISISIEETITSSLMPLARKFVKYNSAIEGEGEFSRD